ncbi:MAG: DNA-processing protein DprA [Egibacteraceae bacterium]
MKTAEWARALCEDTELAVRVVRLAASPDVTPELIRRAVAARLETAAAIDVQAIVEALEEALRRRARLADAAATERAGRALAAAQARLLLVGHPDYPPRLGNAWPELGAPPWIFLRHCLHHGLPDAPSVAVVGTRHPTLDGTQTAARLARLLARHGVVVVSGMARGIDQAAHRGALEGGGLTVGVLGAGFGVDYPYGDGPLRERVAASGGLVTELLPGVAPRPRHFPWRNRILSALADVTVVVEARERSGALQTARLAASQGRDVFAVPGSLSQPTARGPLDLIRDGAQPLCRLEDMLDVLGLTSLEGHAPPAGPLPTLTAPAAAVLRLLGATPAPPDDLAAALGRPIPEILAASAELAARGLALPTARGLVIAGQPGR